mgnify:CR=1 FL=1
MSLWISIRIIAPGFALNMPTIIGRRYEMPKPVFMADISSVMRLSTLSNL